MVLVDADLPDGAGPASVEAVLREDRTLGVACLTRSGDPAFLSRLVTSGAVAVLPADTTLAGLCTVLCEVAIGRVALPAGQLATWLQAGDSERDDQRRARHLAGLITPREHQVLRLLGEGAETREISRRLGVSPETTQTHVRNLLGKLGAGSRLQAVLEAQRLGLLRPPSGLRGVPVPR